MILAQTVLEMNSSEVVGCDIFGRFLNFNNCRPEVLSDVISAAVVEPTGMKVLVQFGDSTSNHSRDIRLPHFYCEQRPLRFA